MRTRAVVTIARARHRPATPRRHGGRGGSAIIGAVPPSPGPSMSEPAHPRARRRLKRQFLGLAVLGTAVGLLLFAQQMVDEAVSGSGIGALRALVKELTSAYAAVLVVPIIVWMARRFPVGRGQWIHLLPHALGVVGVGLLHTLLMFGSRELVYPLLDLLPPQSGTLSARFLKALPVGLIVYALTFAITGIVDRYRRARDREVEAAELRSRLTEAQLGALRSQLEPEFLQHTLHAISQLIYSKPRTAEEMIGRLLALMRHANAPGQERETTLAEELRVLDLYLDIMRLRFAERLFVQLEVPNEIRAAVVPRFILQPLVARALGRSADPYSTLVAVRVQVRREGEDLLVRVRDQGRASDAGPDGGQDLALGNANTRIIQLYGPRYGLRAAANTADGGEIVLRLPFRH